jgi:hypothetical protein
MAEGFDQSPLAHLPEPSHPKGSAVPTDRRTGIRELTDAPPDRFDAFISDPHEASKKFTHGLYENVLGVSDALKRQYPRMSDEQALDRARQVVGRDFMRSVDFLPVGEQVSQSDLARAMIKADRIDGQGRYGELYARNFNEAGVNTHTDKYDGQEAQVAALGRAPEMRLPESLRGGAVFLRDGLDSHAPAQGEAEAYLRAHGQSLGVDGSGMQAQQMYHNDRGETFIYYSNGNGRYDPAATRHVGLGFDNDGRLIQESSGTVHRLPAEGVQG